MDALTKEILENTETFRSLETNAYKAGYQAGYMARKREDELRHEEDMLEREKDYLLMEDHENPS